MRMIKQILFVFILLQAAILHATATDETASDSIFLGNCQGRGVSISESNVTGGALFFPSSRMEAYQGNYVESIYIYMNYPSMVSNLRIFLSESLSGAYNYTSDAEVNRTGWNKIKLDTPYLLNGNGLYIGFTMEGSPVSFAIRQFKGEEYLWEDNEWQPYENATYSIALYAVVRGSNLPLHDAAWECRPPLGYATTRVPSTIEGTVTNKGLADIHSLTFTYRHGNNTTQETVTGLDIAYLGSSPIRLQGPAFQESGNYELSIELSSINGNPDLLMDDNISETFHIQCFDETVQRNVLLELFTTELCPNCPAAHRVIDPLTDGNDRIIRMEHHAGFYTDPYTAEASVEYEWFYGGMRHAPAYMVDRTNRHDRFPGIYNYGTEGPISSVGSVAEVLEDAFHTPAFASVNLEVSNEDGNNYRQITIQANGKSLLPLPESRNARLYIYLTEDSIRTKEQSGATGEYYHRHIVRQCITDTWGDPVNLDEGYEKTYYVQIPEEWDMHQMDVVAVIGNYNENDRNDCEVYNAVSVALDKLIPASSIATSPKRNNAIILKGKFLTIPDDCTRIDIYTLEGILMHSETAKGQPISLHHLPEGVYLYVTTGGKATSTGKIIL